MNKLSRTLIIFGAGIILYIAGLFGTSVLNNLHLSYIRHKAVNIVELTNEQHGGGTGFLIKAKSGKLFILTNRHICKSTQLNILEAIYDNDRYLVNIIKMYEDSDLCLVQAPNTASNYLKLAKSATFGDRVYAVGHPLLEDITLTEGELSTELYITMPIGQNVDPKDCSGHGMHVYDYTKSENPFEVIGAALAGVFNVCLQDYLCDSSTVSILPGNSGSPILNIYGDVVGIAFAANESGTHSYIIPLSVIKTFVNGF